MIEIHGPAQVDPADEQPDTLEAEIFFRRSFYSVVHDGVRLELSSAIIRVFYHSDFDSELITVKIPAVNDEGNVHTHLVYNSHGRAPLSPNVQLYELPQFLRQPVDRLRAALHAMRVEAVHGKVPAPSAAINDAGPEFAPVLREALTAYADKLFEQAAELPRGSHAQDVMEDHAQRVLDYSTDLKHAAELRA